eukprot:gene25733-31077_t
MLYRGFSAAIPVSILHVTSLASQHGQSFEYTNCCIGVVDDRMLRSLILSAQVFVMDASVINGSIQHVCKFAARSQSATRVAVIMLWHIGSDTCFGYQVGDIYSGAAIHPRGRRTGGSSYSWVASGSTLDDMVPADASTKRIIVSQMSAIKGYGQSALRALAERSHREGGLPNLPSGVPVEPKHHE